MAKEKKLDLSELLSAIDRRDYTYYRRLEEDAKKEFSPFVIMRFISSAPNKGQKHEYCLCTANYFVNRNLWTLNEHKELAYLLLCLCGPGTNTYHKWIKHTKKENKKIAWIKLLKEVHSDLNDDELEILRRSHTKQSILDLALSLGKPEKEANDIKKSFN